MKIISLILFTLVFQMAQAQNPYPNQADLEYDKKMMGEMNQEYQDMLNDPTWHKELKQQNSNLGIDQNFLNKEIENYLNTFSKTAQNAATAIDMTECIDITNPQFQQEMAVMEKKSNQFHKEIKALCASGNKAGALAKQAEFGLWAQGQQPIKDNNKCFEKFIDKFEFPESSESETSNYKNSPVTNDICEFYK